MTQTWNELEQRVKGILENLKPEPEAIRHSFDGYGWKYIDSGSGSDWLERGLKFPDAEILYAKS